MRGGEKMVPQECKFTRICSSGNEEFLRACSTYSGERPEIGFQSAALAGIVFTGRSLGGFLGLILTDRGMLLRRVPSSGAACFHFLRRLFRCRSLRRGS